MFRLPTFLVLFGGVLCISRCLWYLNPFFPQFFTVGHMYGSRVKKINIKSVYVNNVKLTHIWMPKYYKNSCWFSNSFLIMSSGNATLQIRNCHESKLAGPTWQWCSSVYFILLFAFRIIHCINEEMLPQTTLFTLLPVQIKPKTVNNKAVICMIYSCGGACWETQCPVFFQGMIWQFKNGSWCQKVSDLCSTFLWMSL